MTLREAKEKYEIIKAEEIYWKERKTILDGIVMPKAMNPTGEIVDGGKRVDKMLLYMEQLDEQKINETLDYIKKEKTTLENYISKLEKIYNTFPTLEKKIYDLRNDQEYKRVHNKPMPFWKIGSIVGYSKSQCREIYNKIVQKCPK